MLRRVIRDVCDLGGARGGEGFDEDVEADEGADDAPGVDRGQVGDVEEGAAEHEVVGEGVDGRGGDEEDGGGDVVAEVLGRVDGDGAHDEAGDEEDASPGEGAGEFPGGVVGGLDDVGENCEEEEDGHDDGGGGVGGEGVEGEAYVGEVDHCCGGGLVVVVGGRSYFCFSRGVCEIGMDWLRI